MHIETSATTDATGARPSTATTGSETPIKTNENNIELNTSAHTSNDQQEQNSNKRKHTNINSNTTEEGDDGKITKKNAAAAAKKQKQSKATAQV